MLWPLLGFSSPPAPCPTYAMDTSSSLISGTATALLLILKKQINTFR